MSLLSAALGKAVRAIATLTCALGLVGPILVAAHVSRANEPANPGRNVILIVVDTLRADRLGCYGNDLGMTPQIDSFARGAVRFENAFAHAPWTLSSVASLFTSQYPGRHQAGGRIGAFRPLREEAVTIAEIARTAGLATGAVVNVSFLTDRFGMTQGFEAVDAPGTGFDVPSRRAGPTTDAALELIDEMRGRSFFLFVHYFDPHTLYDPPEPFRARFADPIDRDSDHPLFSDPYAVNLLRAGKVTVSDEQILRLEKLHNGEVAYVDAEVGRLLAEVSKRGLDANTIVIITADHGEEFLDHGGYEHGHTLYDELLHVPLLIRAPGVGLTQSSRDSVGRSVGTTVRQIDLAPTMCEFVGVLSDPAFMGESLFPLLEGRRQKDRPVLSQGNYWGPSGDCWRNDGFKVIRRLRPGRIALFNIAADPKEQDNLAGKDPRRLDAMLKELNSMLDSITTKAAPPEPPTLSPQETERLRSLGYVQ